MRLKISVSEERRDADAFLIVNIRLWKFSCSSIRLKRPAVDARGISLHYESRHAAYRSEKQVGGLIYHTLLTCYSYTSSKKSGKSLTAGRPAAKAKRPKPARNRLPGCPKPLRASRAEIRKFWIADACIGLWRSRIQISGILCTIYAHFGFVKLSKDDSMEHKIYHPQLRYVLGCSAAARQLPNQCVGARYRDFEVVANPGWLHSRWSYPGVLGEVICWIDRLARLRGLGVGVYRAVLDRVRDRSSGLVLVLLRLQRRKRTSA
jgi:hypothetical protein